MKVETLINDLENVRITMLDYEDGRFRYYTRIDRQTAEELAVALIEAGYRKSIIRRITSWLFKRKEVKE